jgi:DNA-binding NtrC family response regulator
MLVIVSGNLSMLSTTIRTKGDFRRQTPVTLRPANGEPAILVVEDDWSVRRFLCNILRHATPALVVDAADPFAALSIVRKIGRPIDLLISDINLSAAISGIDLARELAATNPSMKVLLMSGVDCPQYEISPAWQFVAKPFPIKIFLDCVNALCRSGSEPATYFG